MKVHTLLTALAACTLACAPVLAQKDAPAKPAPGISTKRPSAPAQPDKKAGPSEQDAMKIMMDAGTPNENHKNIEQLAGDWDAVVKFRMAPDQPWQESKGEMSAHMVYEGRYLHQSFSGDMAGAPFKGTGLMAYNNVAKQYEATWIDSMSTSIMFMSGSYDSAKKSFICAGDSADPMQGGKKKHTRIITIISSPDKHTAEFFEPGMDGKESKVMEITYTRKTGAAKTGDATHAK